MAFGSSDRSASGKKKGSGEKPGALMMSNPISVAQRRSGCRGWNRLRADEGGGR